MKSESKFSIDRASYVRCERPLGDKTSFITILIAVAIATTVFALDVSLPLGVAGGVPYVALVLAGWWFSSRQTIFLLATAATVLTLLGLFLSPAGGVLWVVLLNRAYAIFAIWVTAIILWIARRSRARIKDAMNSAHIASRAKTDLLANMSHELRTPLNAIIGFSGSLNEETFGSVGSDKNREYLNDIMSSGVHLLGLINDILDVSAIEEGRLKLHEENISIANIVETVIHMLRPRAERAQVTIKPLTGNAIPMIYADERRVKQVMINLISNAIKFTPEGGNISVGVSRKDDGSLAIEVIDNGIGMDDEEAAISLSRFGQVDSSLDRKHEGTGLGLPLTQGLMELHGGTLKIESEKGQGTLVTVTFPKERVVLGVS